MALRVWAGPYLIQTAVVSSGLTCLAAQQTGPSSTPKSIKEVQDEAAKQSHEIDSVALLTYMFLLILTILTVWGFKHYRLRFIHETGLSIIYGLIVGAIIEFTKGTLDLPSEDVTSAIVHLPANSSYGYENNPDNLVLQTVGGTPNSSAYYQYTFAMALSSSEVTQSSIKQRVTFDPEIFFYALLPPIIFNAGYSMKRRHFFRNLGAILTYAFIGTALTALVIGGILYGLTRVMTADMQAFTFVELLGYGSILSATDPVTILAIFAELNVDVDLYAIIFGESVLNDAVAIVLSDSVFKYASYDDYGLAIGLSVGFFILTLVGSFLIGLLVGCINAMLTKFTRIEEHPLLESALFIMMSYMTYLIGEALNLSGIVAVLFCGVFQAHYTFNNLSDEAKHSTKSVFELLNFLAENFVFLYIGLSIFTFESHNYRADFIGAALFAMLASRIVCVYPLTFFINLVRHRGDRISLNMQHMLMFSGLRGAMAFALSIRNTSTLLRRTMLSTTLMLVIFTVVICGGLTMNMLHWLKIKVGVDDATDGTDRPTISTVSSNYQTITPQSDRPAARAVPATVRGATISEDRTKIARWWNSLDNFILKPILTNYRHTLADNFPNSKYCLALSRLLTTTKQRMLQAEREHDDSDVPIIDQDELTLSRPPTNGRVYVDGDLAVGSGLADDGDLGLGQQLEHGRMEIS